MRYGAIRRGPLRRGRSIPRLLPAVLSGLVLAASPAFPQVVERILQQDPSLDNLADPPGYRVAEPGTLGGFRKVGSGPQSMILIPGLGFGGDSFADFMAPLQGRFTMYTVTLAGFGGTAAPPSPPPGTSFGAQTWTDGALSAIEEMVRTEGIEKPVLVGHWMTGTQLALRLALRHPDQVRGVIILSGTTRLTPTGGTEGAPPTLSLEQRVAGIDSFMAPRWFKTVTRETWDDNNFLPGDYAVNPVRGLRLWREAARPPLHVWVRYLCEFLAQDISLELGGLKVPTLVLKPGLEGIFHDPGNNYMEAYAQAGWDGSVLQNPRVTIQTIPDSRVFLWYDQPEAVSAAIDAFLAKLPAEQARAEPGGAD